MRKHDQSGAMQTSVLVAGVMTVLFFVSLIMALVFFMGKSDIEKNLDTKVQQSLEIETKKIEAAKDIELAEKEKSPTKTYTAPSTVGSVSFAYPKTYSAYVEEQLSGGAKPLNAYFHPNVVPRDDTKILYALRVEVVTNAYDVELRAADTYVATGKAKVTAFSAAAVPSVLGSRVDGEFTAGKQGTLILIPIRDKTLRIWSESKDAFADFEKFVLPSLTFVP